MNKQEFAERLTEQRLLLSEIRTNIRSQLRKCPDIPHTSDYKDMVGGNPIVMEVFQASVSINLAFMWLGKAKGYCGETYPYSQSYDPSNKIIEKSVDVATTEQKEYADPIEMLKSIRADLKTLDAQIVKNLRIADMIVGTHKDTVGLMESVQAAFQAFQEACMWLGVGLGNIRDRGLEDLKWTSPDLVDPTGFKFNPEVLETRTSELGDTKNLDPLAHEKAKELWDEAIRASRPSSDKLVLAGQDVPTSPKTSETETLNNHESSDSERRTETDNPTGAGDTGSTGDQPADQVAGGQGNSEETPAPGQDGGR